MIISRQFKPRIRYWNVLTMISMECHDCLMSIIISICGGYIIICGAYFII